MASADQLKALLQSHLDGDEDRFFAVAMQVAAHEAKLGHGRLAEDLRKLIDKAKSHRPATRTRTPDRKCVLPVADRPALRATEKLPAEYRTRPLSFRHWQRTCQSDIRRRYQ